ncbi:plasma-membrane choline transporter-domain-containing protein [Lipomyces oligophaga]|uniref:plasma-membrane choline transporter-domain-containing protein n=1 Tax=Lipomyces oligophaga TaxID=45792 RepID=UPI0034CF73CD
MAQYSPQNQPTYPPPQQQQIYGGGQAPPSYDYQAASTNEKFNRNEKTFEEQFKVEKPKWNDIWALVFFLGIVAGFCVVSGITINGYSKNHSFFGGTIYGGAESFSLNTNTIILLGFDVVIALVLSVLYFWMARIFTKQFIWITGILNVVLGFATAIYYFAEHYYSAAITFLIFAVMGALAFFSFIKRIPFATLILQTIMDVTKSQPSVLGVSLIGTLVVAAFGAWFSVTLVATYARYNPTVDNPNCSSSGSGGCSHATLIGLIVFITFCGYYITEVIKNIIHTTIAGVYGSWYFCSRSIEGMPRFPALGAFKRSMTYSLGSISFGSLIVSVIQLLQQLAGWGEQAARQNDNIIAVALICVLRFFIMFLQWAVQFFNHYAYCYIALYGSAYIPAAKETWKMLKDRGFDALANDCLIDPVFNLGAQFVGYVSALFAYLYLTYTKPAYNDGGNYNAPVVAFAFVMGLQICSIGGTPIKSGAATFFTAMARDPEVLRMSYPELYNEIARLYPHVMQAVHS